MTKRLGFRRDTVFSQPTFVVGQRALQHADDIIDRHRLQLENLRTRHERRVHVEIRIVGRGADEADDPALDVRQQHVLLGFVETVDLVDEKDRRLAPQLAPGAGLVDFRPDFGDVGFHAVDGFEAGAGRPRDHAGKGGFASARRSVKNQRREPVRLDRPAQQLARSEDVLLACHFLKRARPHPCRQGFGGCRLVRRGGGSGEKIGHGGCST